MRLRVAFLGCGRGAGLLLLAALQAGCASGTEDRPHLDSPGSDGPPSLVVLFADDLGYGDLSSYGHPTIRTPHLDRMAREGIRLTSFYAAAPVCTPSRDECETDPRALHAVNRLESRV